MNATDPGMVILIAIPAILGGISSVVAMIVSIVTVLKVIETHKLVNSQYSRQVEKTNEALIALAEAVPTAANIQAAKTATQIAEDRQKGL